MNKKELLEELTKETNDNAEIRIDKGTKLSENVLIDFRKVQERFKELDKVIEELLRDGFPETWSAINESYGGVELALDYLSDALTIASNELERNEVIADTVEFTNRRDESGAHYHAVIIGE